jgi:hypothetical protein
MKKQTVTALTIAFGLITITPIDTTAYPAPQVTQPDTKAIWIVSAALKLSNPANPKTARIHAEGNLLLNNQGLNPQQSTRTQRLSADWKVDFQNRRFLHRSANYLGKDLMWCSEIVVAREARYELFCHSRGFRRALCQELSSRITAEGDLTGIRQKSLSSRPPGP